MKLADQQNAILKRMGYLEDKIEGLQGSKKQNDKLCCEKQGRIVEKIEQHQAKLKSLLFQKDLQSKKYKQHCEQYDSLLNEIEKEDFQNSYEIARIKGNEEIQEVILNDRLKEIDNIKAKIVNLNLFRSNSGCLLKIILSFNAPKMTKHTSKTTSKRLAEISLEPSFNSYK